MRALAASLALVTAAASAQPVAVPSRPAPAPVLGLSELDCSRGAVADHLSVPEVPAGPAVRLDPGGVAAVPMPNVCAEPAPLAVLPEGVRFRTVPRGLDDGLDRHLEHLRRLEELRDLLRPAPSPGALDGFRPRLFELEGPPPDGSRGH